MYVSKLRFAQTTPEFWVWPNLRSIFKIQLWTTFMRHNGIEESLCHKYEWVMSHKPKLIHKCDMTHPNVTHWHQNFVTPQSQPYHAGERFTLNIAISHVSHIISNAAYMTMRSCTHATRHHLTDSRWLVTQPCHLWVWHDSLHTLHMQMHKTCHDNALLTHATRHHLAYSCSHLLPTKTMTTAI